MKDKSQSALVFGEVLKELRLARGFTQDKLAELAKVPLHTHGLGTLRPPYLGQQSCHLTDACNND